MLSDEQRIGYVTGAGTLTVCVAKASDDIGDILNTTNGAIS